MPLILEKLHNDHINFISLLLFLEKQLLFLEDGRRSDLSTIFDAITYMKEYPDFIHHPLENVVFKYFLEHYDSSNESVIELMHEHELMPLLTDKLLEMLHGALAEIPQNRDDLCAYLNKYISIQKEHMNQEEVSIYPKLNAMLDDNDWNVINTEVAKIEDPLFGEKVKKTYQTLLQEIIS